MIIIGEGGVAIDRPTYATLFGRWIATIESRLPGSDARVPASDLNVQAHVMAETAGGMYDFGVRISKQIVPGPDMDEDQLVVYAADWGIYQQPAVAATGTVTLTRIGLGTVTVEAGTILRLAGSDYGTDSEVTIGADIAVVTVPITALETGVGGNQDAGATMAMTSPISGLSAKGVSGVISGGADAESKEALLARLLARMRRPPHGGCADDYTRWARDCAGITRAWTYKATPRRGYVTVLVVRDNNVGGPIPTADEVAAVQAYMDRPDVSPVTGECIVRAPVPVPVDLVIALDPNTADARTSVTAAVRSWYRAESEPGQLGARSRMSAAISAAAGEERHRIVSPAADPALGAFDMAVINSITFEDYD